MRARARSLRRGLCRGFCRSECARLCYGGMGIPLRSNHIPLHASADNESSKILSPLDCASGRKRSCRGRLAASLHHTCEATLPSPLSWVADPRVVFWRSRGSIMWTPQVSSEGARLAPFALRWSVGQLLLAKNSLVSCLFKLNQMQRPEMGTTARPWKRPAALAARDGGWGRVPVMLHQWHTVRYGMNSPTPTPTSSRRLGTSRRGGAPHCRWGAALSHFRWAWKPQAPTSPTLISPGAPHTCTSMRTHHGSQVCQPQPPPSLRELRLGPCPHRVRKACHRAAPWTPRHGHCFLMINLSLSRAEADLSLSRGLGSGRCRLLLQDLYESCARGGALEPRARCV
jgi:hypothetical protein